MLYELTGVKVAFGPVTALSIDRLKIDRGERVALLGPNGSGKTSLLKLLDGLVDPQEGAVLREGKPNSRSVYLHQYPYLLCGTVAYNVAFGCRARGLSRKETLSRTERALSILGLRGMENRGHRALSGGEAQRVALARAIASGSDVLLLDEPTASADAESAVLIASALRSIADAGTTILFSTHDEDFARETAPRTVRLKAGRIIADTGGAR